MKSKNKSYTVYRPCNYSEVYENVEAENAVEAIHKVRKGEYEPAYEIISGREEEGDRAEVDSESDGGS